MVIIKDTSKQYKLKEQKKKEYLEKIQRDYEKFSNPKYVVFTCNKCKTIFTNSLEELKFKDNIKTRLDYDFLTDSHGFALTAWATCPTCKDYFKLYKEKHTKNFIIRFFNFLKGAL